ncbi:hypothetical protein FRC19_010899 [Serendipita sp. 401]|nr:hypothetical protein FRC19_010899 [Serendipita sp. 401]
MFSGAQVALFAVLTASTVNAFSPLFSTPRQCGSLKITWSSMDTAALSHTEVTMSLIPLDSPSHIVPEPYVLTVPSILESGEIEVPALPFKTGTQFFASAYIPGNAGPVRRTVSSVFTVEESIDSSCLKVHVPEGRARPKAFGKRQVNVVGATTVDASSLTASPAASATGVVPPINVIGVGVIPSDSAAASATTTDASSTVSSSAAAATSTGPVPPIRVIGESTIPATGGGGSADPPANAAPAPAASSGGAVPPINVIGTGVVPADGSSATTTATETTATETSAESTSTDSSATETSTPCTETATEAPTSTETAAPEIITTSIAMPGMEQSNSADAESQPCEDGTDYPVYESTDGSMPSETSTSTRAFNTEVVQYDSFDDMVNAANSAFHAWNPYGPNYTPSP